MARYTGSITQRLIGGNNIIPISRFHLQMFGGDVWAVMLLSQLLYWQDGRTRHPDGWVVKTYQEWFWELSITEKRLDNARYLLSAVGLETATFKSQFHNGERALHWRIDLDIFERAQVNFAAELSEIEAKIRAENPENNDQKYPESLSIKSTQSTFLYLQRLTETTKTTCASAGTNSPEEPKDPQPLSSSEKPTLKKAGSLKTVSEPKQVSVPPAPAPRADVNDRSQAKPRAQDPVFEAVRFYIFGLNTGGNGALIGRLAAWLKGQISAYKVGRDVIDIGDVPQVAIADDVKAFADWWRGKYPTADIPRDIGKFVNHWGKWWGSVRRHKYAQVSDATIDQIPQNEDSGGYNRDMAIGYDVPINIRKDKNHE